MNRLLAAALLFVSLALAESPQVQAAGADVPESENQTHIAWVIEVLGHMESIRPGMSRRDLLAVFRTDGPNYAGMRFRRSFVSRECSLFRVDVEFEAVGPSQEGAERLAENENDRIAKISTPYVQFPPIR